MRVTILGSGTSTGVPVPGCTCSVCTSDNPKNNRMRTSAYIEIQHKDRASGSAPKDAGTDPEQIVGCILIDTSTDLRAQALRFGISRIDAVLFTHTHADHIFGIDDLRCFNFLRKGEIAVYASRQTADDLEHRFNYCFNGDLAYEGGAPPDLSLNRIAAYEPLELFGVNIIPLPLLHGSAEVFGYRFGPFAYLTDCSHIQQKTKEQLKGLEVLILDGLRHRPHNTHFTHEQAVEEIKILGPKQTYLTHISHEVEHDDANARLSKASDLQVECGYDGLTLEF